MASLKLKNAVAESAEESTMDISSMIDLVFLLLIFFMTASHIIVVPLDEEVKVPKADHAEAPDMTVGRILLNIRADGTVLSVDKKVLAGPDDDVSEVASYILELAEDLREQEQINPKLHIRADQEVEVKRIKEVVQAGADAQVIDVIFASTKE